MVITSIGLIIERMKESMRIGAGIVSFDDERGLRRCMNSIHDYVDLMMVIDGKFRYFEDDHDISSDNSRDVVESFSNSAYYCYPNLTEIEKRNKYLEFAGDQGIEFLLVIDSDEFAVINKAEFLLHLDNVRNLKINSGYRGDITDVYGIKIFEKHFEKPNSIRERYIERIFYKPGNLRYQSIHCNLVDVNNPARNFTTGKYTSEIHGITLYNDDEVDIQSLFRKKCPISKHSFRGETWST